MKYNSLVVYMYMYVYHQLTKQMVKIQSATMTQMNGMRINHINVFSSLHNTGVISISIVDKCCTGDAKHVKTGLVNIFFCSFSFIFYFVFQSFVWRVSDYGGIWF